MNTRKHILVFFAIFGIFLVPVGNIMTIQGRFAKGDDSYIYLVDFDETAYDMYIQGYYPTDYTYADFRRDSIEGMVSHYVATDNNNFSAVVDTVENAVINDGWSAIKDFFENAWIDLKSGVVTVEEGFTDDFKHTLDGRFKITPPAGVYINGHLWYKLPATCVGKSTYSNAAYGLRQGSYDDVYITLFGAPQNSSTIARGATICSFHRYTTSQVGIEVTSSYTGSIASGYYGQIFSGYSGIVSCTGLTTYSYTSNTEAWADFFGYPIEESDGTPYWNGDGFYSDTPMDFSINLPALPAINWSSISNNNKTKYGVDFPDVNVSVDFQLPDMYYPRSVTYDVPYWLQNGDETVVDWQNISFDDVTLPSLEMEDGNGGFIQHLFTALPVGFSVFLLGVLICYLIFIML